LSSGFWGLRLASLVGAALRGSQLCSALRGLCPLGLAFGHPSTSLGLRALCALQAAPPFGPRREEHLFGKKQNKSPKRGRLLLKKINKDLF